MELFGIKVQCTVAQHFSNWIMALLRLIQEYNENTTLHGLKYITETGRNIFERIFWSLIVLAAIIFGVYLTLLILNRWQDSPIIVSVDSTNFPVNLIPFPAVTVCPTYKGIKEKVISEVCKRGWVFRTNTMQNNLNKKCNLYNKSGRNLFNL